MKLEDAQLAQDQWNKYLNSLYRGHLEYQQRARLCEDFYIGSGNQWEEGLKKQLDELGKPWQEENIIFSTINTVLGYQTQSRMSIAYKPREVNDQDVSDILQKLAMYEVDRNKYPWKESQVFADGIIQSRGFFDVRIDFDDNMYGNISIETLDPLDVIPDQNAKSYDPDEWDDVLVTKWVSILDIEKTYGKKKADEIRKQYNYDPAAGDWGDDGFEVPRNKFGNLLSTMSFYVSPDEVLHVRILERQHWKLQLRELWYSVETGDFYPIPEDITAREKKQVARKNNYEIIKKVVKRVRWTVTTNTCVLHDDWSPYDSFTIVPYFPYFRRGKTISLVDNLIKTQEMLNKVFSQILHVVNTTANSGWKVEQNSLVNMDVEDLEDVGAQSGLVLEYKAGRNPPEKIEPNPIPQGLNELFNTGVDLMRMISGVSETFQGNKSNEVSGVAIQSRVYQSAVQLATPIDNLFRTRYMLAQKLLQLIQKFYTEQRMFIVVQDSEDDEKQQVVINQKLNDDGFINDVTVGKYDVVITDVPTQVTFQNAQFSQAVELRKYGVQIPDEEMILMSTLARKKEIADKISGAGQQQVMQQQMEKQMELLQKQIEKLEADIRSNQMKDMDLASKIATLIRQDAGVAPVMDALMETADSKLEEDETEDTNEGQGEGTGQEGMLGQVPEQPLTAKDVFI